MDEWARVGVLNVKTSPCPRCGSFNTRAIGILGGAEPQIMTRQCISCKWQWDFVPEFAPPKRKRKSKPSSPSPETDGR